MKQCTTCNEHKELSEFHKNKCRVDGYMHQCKPCRKTARIGYYTNRKPHYLRKNAEYRKKRPDWASRAYAWRQKNMEHVKEYVANHPLTKLRMQTYRLIVNGTILKTPCRICGKIQVESHHYLPEPMAVRFYCKKHHARLHRMIRYKHWRTVQANDRWQKDRI